MTYRHWTIAALLIALAVLTIAEVIALRSTAKGDTISEITRDEFSRSGHFALPLLCAWCFGIGMLTAHFFWLQRGPDKSNAAIESIEGDFHVK